MKRILASAAVALGLATQAVAATASSAAKMIERFIAGRSSFFQGYASVSAWF